MKTKQGLRGQVIWDKGASVGVSMAWGSWLSPTNPTLRDVHGYLLVFSNGTNRHMQAQDSGDPDIIKEEFLGQGGITLPQARLELAGDSAHISG